MSDYKTFPGIQDGQTFEAASIEFIKFPSVDGKTPVVAREILFNSRFGENNNLIESRVLERLETEILPKVIAEVGEENVCTFETDLTTLDGLKPYGIMESRISLPTFDFYRANVDIFDKHPVENWWWLATPDTASPHYDPVCTVCVSPSGIFYGDDYYGDYGVRPILIFESSIFESSEK